MNKYEALYILRSDLAEDAIEAQTAKYAKAVADYKGEVEKIDKWGVKRLAYPINFKTEGFYVLMTFTAPGNFNVELERQMKIADEVIRYIVIRKDGADVKAGAAKPEARPTAKPAAKIETEPTAKPAVTIETEPTEQPTAKIETEPAEQPLAEAAAKIETEPAEQPLAEAAAKIETEPAEQPLAEAAAKIETEPAEQPLAEAAAKIETEPAEQPLVDQGEDKNE